MSRYKYTETEQQMNNVLVYHDRELKAIQEKRDSIDARGTIDASIELLKSLGYGDKVSEIAHAGTKRKRDVIVLRDWQDNLMDGYGITLEELHDQALKNMNTLQPHSFKGMNETVAEMIAVDIAREQNVGMDEAKEMAMQMMPDIPDTMYVLTNDTKVNGAAAILNDDIRQEIAEKVGDFYMLPSSIHETLIIPKDAGMEFKELEQMVQEVNQTQVAPGERLSEIKMRTSIRH